MRVEVKITGDFADITAREFAAGERAVTRAVGSAGATLKTLWREQIAQAGLGTKLGRTIRNRTYPGDQPSMNAAALVWTKAPKIIAAHDQGPVIRSPSGFWLAIPLPSAGRGASGGKIRPAEWERKTGRRLVFVYRHGRSALLVDEGKKAPGNVMVRRRTKGGFKLAEPATFRNRSVPIFVLVPYVRLKKRISLSMATQQATAGLAERIVANWR